jgi:glucose-6-phosphate 1-dehydrogenase
VKGVKGVKGEKGKNEMMYEIKEDVRARLHNNFTYHEPKYNDTERYEELREAAKSLAEFLCRNCPPSSELSVALTKLEEVMFWANAAIARNESSAVPAIWCFHERKRRCSFFGGQWT